MSRKENALDLAKFIDKGVRVKLSGGREGENALDNYFRVEVLSMSPSSNFHWKCAVQLRAFSKAMISS